jgi:Family of unknown function (DUF6155)
MEHKIKTGKKTSLKTYLAGFTKEQLIGQLIELNKKYKDVKSYYDFFLNPDSSKKSEEVKIAILHCFYPTRGYKLRLKDARKAVNDFKKLSPDEASLLDVMIYYVECGVTFTNDFGDIDEPFYNSVAGMFRQAGTLYLHMAKNKSFRDRAEKIMNDTSGIGWGFHDELSDVYYNYFK